MKIKICADVKHPPYEFINRMGEPDGFNIDITKEICKNQGIELTIDLLDWVEAVKKFENDEYDAIQGMSVKDERLDYIFPIKYLESLHIFCTTKDIYKNFGFEELLNMRIGVQEQDVKEQLFKRINIKNRAKIYKFSDQEEVIDALIAKKIDIAIGNKNTIMYYSLAKGIEKSIKFIGFPISSTVFSIAFKSKNIDLANKFKEGMKEIKRQGIYSRFYDKWFGKRLDNYGKSIIENIDMGIIFVSVKNRIISMNQSARELLSIKHNDFEKIETHKLGKLVDFSYVTKIVEGKEKSLYIEKPFEIENKTKRYLGISYNPFISRDDKLVGVLINIKDVSEEVALKEKLATKDRIETLGEMLSNVAHEIRNPLTSINNFVNLLPENMDDKEFIDSLLKYVPKQIQFINNLLENLLNYSKPSIGKREKIDIEATIVDILNILKINYDFEYKLYMDRKMQIYIDRNHFIQIIYNVICNGLESTDRSEDKKIEIKIFETDDKIDINIRDYGCGIEEKDKSKIFNPFYTTKAKGTGLGLYIVYNLIEINNGEINFKSLNKGTLVNIKLKKEHD